MKKVVFVILIALMLVGVAPAAHAEHFPMYSWQR